MLNTTQKYFNDLLEKNKERPQKVVEDLLLLFLSVVSNKDDVVDVFSLCKQIGIRLIIADYQDDVSQFIKRGKNKKSYICLNATSDTRRLRLDAASLLYCALHSKKTGTEIVTKSADNKNLHRAKKFGAYLLMPQKALKKVLFEKDEDGQYKYLVNLNGELTIPFNNIYYIAERFGVEFSTCAKRVLYSNLVAIENVKDIQTLKEKLPTPSAIEKMRKELIPDCEKDDYRLKCSLFNSLHFPNIDTANEVVKEKLRVESIKNDCVIEGVVSSAKGMDKFLAKYRVDPESTREQMRSFSPAQRIMLGHYDAIKELGHQPFSKYFLNYLHAEMFKYAIITSDDDAPLQFEVFGNFRRSNNRISGANFSTDNYNMIHNSIFNINCDISELLENKDSYSPVEYMTRVNNISHRFLVCHPFEDGNGRVSRLLQNYLFMQKGFPPFFVNASKRKEEYIEALQNLSDSCRYKAIDDLDYSKLNSLVMDCIIETEGIFYSAKAMIEDPNKAIDDIKKDHL